MIIGGDWNCILEAEDKFPRSVNFNHNNELQHMSESLDLKDCFKQLHPDKNKYTYFKNNYHSRLDRFYSNYLLQNQITNIVHISNFGTDHKLSIKIMITNISAIESGKDIWCMNNIILEEKNFIESLRTFIKACIMETEDFDPVDRWILLKKIIARKLAKQSRILAKKRKKQEKMAWYEYNNTVNNLSKSSDDISAYEQFTKAATNYQENFIEIQGKLRSKRTNNFLAYSESNAKSLFGRLKQKNSSKIAELIDVDNSL